MAFIKSGLSGSFGNLSGTMIANSLLKCLIPDSTYLNIQFTAASGNRVAAIGSPFIKLSTAAVFRLISPCLEPGLCYPV
jgi:hypothetical protein